MTPYVVSERTRNVSRDESYSRWPGPAIPGGVMHACHNGAHSTLCGMPGPDLHHWPALVFPRRYGNHCIVCKDELAKARQAGSPAD